jgi:hypothetical protein
MEAIAPPVIASPAAWQALLDAHDELFEELVPGAWLGVVPRHRTGADGHRQSTAVAVTPRMPMIVLLRERDRMTAREGEFRGLETLTADALLVVGEDGVDAALDRPPDAALRELKRLIRTGAVALFFLRTRRELFERGYEELFEALGLPVLGTCR